MLRGLVEKAVRETWRTTLLLGAGLIGVELLLTYVLPFFQDDSIVATITKIPFVRALMSALMGVNIAADDGVDLLLVLPWAHPIVLTLSFAHVAIQLSRVPAGEVDRGTADLLLTLPASRAMILLAELIVWCGSAALLVACTAGGFLAGVALSGNDLPPLGTIAGVAMNLFFVLGAVAGLTVACSAVSNQRVKVMGVVLVAIVGSFLISFLAEMWEPASRLGFLSFLSYYRPVYVLHGGEWPWGHFAALTGCGAGFTAIGAWIFSRREIHAA